MTDNIRGSDFTARGLVLALKAGDPLRLVQALSLEEGYVSTVGHKQIPRAERIHAVLEHAAGLVGSEGNSEVWVLSSEGVRHYLTGNFRRSAEVLARAHEVIERNPAGLSWPQAVVRHHMVHARGLLGDVRLLSEVVPGYLSDANNRGEAFSIANLRLGLPNLAWLVDGDGQEARRVSDAAARCLEKQGFHLQHWNEMHSKAQIELFQGDAKAAFDYVNSRWRLMNHSLLMRVEIVRALARFVRVRTALALARQSAPSERTPYLRIASRGVDHLLGESAPYAEGLARMAGAALAWNRNDPDGAHRMLRRAIECLDRDGLALHAAAARHRLGCILKGQEGTELLAEANLWMKGQRLRYPDQWIQMMAPGFELMN